MREFTGRSGKLFLVSDPVGFTHLPLVDCGDGFDWRASDEAMSFWKPDGLLVEALIGDTWVTMGLREQHVAVGKVGFNRCLSGRQVRASGWCKPKSIVGTYDRWVLKVLFNVEDSSVLGEVNGSNRLVPAGSSAVLSGSVYHVTSNGVFVSVMPASQGFFVGEGSAVFSDSSAYVVFNENGVVYAP